MIGPHILFLSVPQSELTANVEIRSIRITVMSQRKHRFIQQIFVYSDEFCVFSCDVIIYAPHFVQFHVQ